jgi:hypothetical protein
MKTWMTVAFVLLATAAISRPVRANDGFGKSGPLVKTAAVNSRGNVVASAARLQPVIGSIQRTSHFTNPFTHKAKYTGTVYNPLAGTFSAKTYRR